ncbi:MAG: S1 RNA-binding domain-containing protein [Patescibacteria group bacterium]|nr:S1 RNA-binding domain-containing protein [Patescibacteria group bacterium]
MKQLLEKNELLRPIKIGELVEGKVVGKGRSSVFVDLGPVGTGIIYGKEFYDAKYKLKKLKVGDEVFAKVTDIETDDGFIELSMKRATREMTFEELRKKKEDGELVTVRILGANKGGLVTEVSGLSAFLPVSQLSNENYPKVEGGERSKILQELQKFVGKDMEVKILDLFERKEQVILSEKAKDLEKTKEKLKKFKIGDKVKGEITGVTDFGAFIKFPLSTKKDIEQLEGLVHISELDWKIINSPQDIVKVGDKIKAQIIEISGNRVWLSLKALKKDPWKGINEKYKKGDIIKGEVTKLNPFGAFVKLDKEIQGLCHVSEFENQKMEEILELEKTYKFKILSIEEKEHKMSLKLIKE